MRKTFRPDIPINPETFLFNTLHLSAEEFGAFTLLAFHSWRENPPCSLPSDDSTLARIARLSDERWAECKHRVLALFTSGSASRLYQKELRSTHDTLRRKHAARVQAAMEAVNQRNNKPNDVNEIHTNRRPIVQRDVQQTFHQNGTIPPHPPVLEEFSLSSDISFSEKKNVPVVVQGSLDSAVQEISVRIHARHPALRRCGVTVIQKQLRSIVRKIHAVTAKIEKLREIDSIHEQWCATWEWTKEGGQFAKGLQNWLAPTKERWETPPEEAGGFGNSLFSTDSKMAKTLLAFEVMPKL